MFICKTFDSVNYGGLAHTKKSKISTTFLLYISLTVDKRSGKVQDDEKMELRALHGICKQ